MIRFFRSSFSMSSPRSSAYWFIVLPIPRVAGAPVAATVVGDDAIAKPTEEDHLRIPGVRAERPSVREEDGLPLAEVAIEDLGAVVREDRAHGDRI